MVDLVAVRGGWWWWRMFWMVKTVERRWRRVDLRMVVDGGRKMVVEEW